MFSSSSPYCSFTSFLIPEANTLSIMHTSMVIMSAFFSVIQQQRHYIQVIVYACKGLTLLPYPAIRMGQPGVTISL